MSDVREENAQIESTHLGFEDHRIFTAWIQLRYDGSGQGFGGYGLSGAFTDWFLRECLRVTGADCWEKIPKRYVRVRYTFGKVIAIGCIENDPLRTRIKGDWFDPSTFHSASKETE